MVGTLRSRFSDLFKHPGWVSVGVVVGASALGISAIGAFHSSRTSGERLSIAAVTLDQPTSVDAVYVSPADPIRVYPGSDLSEPTDDVSAEPVDVTLKNNGRSTATINTLTATVVRSDYLGSCNMQGAGGVGISADYALQIPRGSSVTGPFEDQVSKDIDFKVPPGQTSRLAVTIGPQNQAENSAVIMAVRFSFGLSEGGTVETEPIIIGTTPAIIERLATEVPDARIPNIQGKFAACRKEQLAKVDEYVSLGGPVSKSVEELRAVYQRTTGARSPEAGAGDLSLDRPINNPPCDGQGIVILQSFTTPSQYAESVQKLLNQHPSANYLRTDRTCPSLRQSVSGNPIYAVWLPGGRTEDEVCAAVRAAGQGSYGKWLDNKTDPGFILPC